MYFLKVCTELITNRLSGQCFVNKQQTKTENVQRKLTNGPPDINYKQIIAHVEMVLYSLVLPCKLNFPAKSFENFIWTM